MIVGVLKEPAFESRVSLLTDGVEALVRKKVEVWVEKGAGERSFCADSSYLEAGARLVSREELLAGAAVVLAIHAENIPPFLRDKISIGVYQPLFRVAEMADWAAR